MSKKFKSMKHKRPTDPNQQGGDGGKCKYDGHADVSGTIEFGITPSLENKLDTERRENTAHENKKLLVEWLTLRRGCARRL
jgi:hypothetical protein